MQEIYSLVNVYLVVYISIVIFSSLTNPICQKFCSTYLWKEENIKAFT
jgi:uncharacterized membrane protein